MGKPPSRQSKSEQHTSSINSKEKMNTQLRSLKNHKKLKKSRSKTKTNIKKLFDRLRNDSSQSSQCSFESLNNTVIEVDTAKPLFASKSVTCCSSHKRKLPEPNSNANFKLKKLNDSSCIIIEDDHKPCTSTQTYEPNISLLTPQIPCKSTLTPQKPCNSSLTPQKPCNSTLTPQKPPFTLAPKNSTVNCSTPLIKNNMKGLHDLIISNFPKINNNSQDVINFNEDVDNLTREINQDSFITIDLTTETTADTSKAKDTVIDLENTNENDDVTVISVSEANLSISGESDVTVVNVSKRKKDKQMRQFVKGIAKMTGSDKDRLLEMITENIFKGCRAPKRRAFTAGGNTSGAGIAGTSEGNGIKKPESKATETEQDSYIKEVILGQGSTRNSIGSNIYNPEKDINNKTGLRMIVIDGSNVAMEHMRGREFSVKGLKICIDYFLKRGHVVKAFVPRFRCKFGKSTDPRLLDSLERKGHVIYTPSREVQGRMITSYDDRYIVQCAAEFDGIIVSGDNYRDLMRENPRWRFVIENRLLQFTWVGDMIMFPRDPMGRNGPSLEQFLKHNGTLNIM